jgi:hypothetical protein
MRAHLIRSGKNETPAGGVPGLLGMATHVGREKIVTLKHFDSGKPFATSGCPNCSSDQILTWRPSIETHTVRDVNHLTIDMYGYIL